MKWVNEAVAALFPGSDDKGNGAGDPVRARAGLAKKLGDALGDVGVEAELRDILDAGTLLLHHAAAEGELTFTDLKNAKALFACQPASSKDVSVIGLGLMAREVLIRMGSGHAARFFLDVERSQPLPLDADVVRVMLDSQSSGDLAHSMAEMLKSAYRASAGSRGLPDVLADSLLPPPGKRPAVHVVVSLEDPWISLLPELLFDLRAFLEHGKKGRVVLHILTKPSPRLRGIYRTVCEEIAAQHAFDDVFVICAPDAEQPRRAADFIQMSQRVPELLVPRFEARTRGPFSSYGMARAPAAEGKPAAYMGRLEEAYKAAAPSWVPLNAVLSECVSEQTVYVHPPDRPPLEQSWKICPELMPASVDGAEPTICRIQRGLKLEDLKLM